MLNEPSHLNQEEAYLQIQFLSPSLEDQLQLSAAEKTDLKHCKSQNNVGWTTFFLNLTWCKNSTVSLTVSKQEQSTMQELKY